MWQTDDTSAEQPKKMTSSESPFHPTALGESKTVGAGTRVWAFAHVMCDASIGGNCNIGDHAFIESGAHIGNNVTIKNHVCVWQGVTIEDDSFIGPGVVFTNDKNPRSPRMSEAVGRYRKATTGLESTHVHRGCSSGANATVLPGVSLGQYSMVAAGSTVTSDVAPFALVMGVPAKQVGWVCRCGARVDERPATCPQCGYSLADAFAA